VNNVFIFSLVTLTSVFAYYGTDSKKNPRLRDAIRAFFEWTGTFSIFCAANLACGVLIISLIRAFTPRFVSLYALQNALLLILSAAQAFVFQHLWKRGPNP